VVVALAHLHEEYPMADFEADEMATDIQQSEVISVAVSLSLMVRRVTSIGREPSPGQVELNCMKDDDRRFHLRCPRESALDAAVTILAAWRRPPWIQGWSVVVTSCAMART
jgi:hypothetical protein